VLYTVASSGEHPDLAWEFVQQNFKPLFDRLGPAFRDEVIPDLTLSFTDTSRAAELGRFAPIQASPGGRVEAARAQETIVLSADFKARALPSAAAWIRDHHGNEP
jgi:aminopeptidase N